MAHHLEHSLQLEVYLAEVKQYRHGALQRVPLFPGYLFISAPGGSPAGGLAAVERIDHLSGCGRLVRRHDDHSATEGSPAVLPGVLVEQLRQRLAAGEAAQDSASPPERGGEHRQWRRAGFELEGALTGLQPASARIELLLRVAGAVTAEEDSTEHEPPPSAAKRPRRTRGHGRRIHYQ